MDDELYGKGLEAALEIQRQLNELDDLMFRQIELSRAEDPWEKIAELAADAAREEMELN